VTFNKCFAVSQSERGEIGCYSNGGGQSED